MADPESRAVPTPAGDAAPETPPAVWTILLAFAAVYVIWGSTYLAIRFAIETLPPFLMAGSRFVVAGAVLYGWARLRGQPAPPRVHWRSAALLGALLLVGGNGGVVWAEQRVASGLAALLVSTVPLWVVVLEGLGPRVVRGARPGRPVLLGVAAGLAGVAWLVGPQDLAGAGGVDLLGALVLVGASLSWAFGSLWSRRLPLPASPLLGTAMEMLAGGALLLLAGAVSGEIPRLADIDPSARSLLALLYLVLFGSLVAFTAYVFLLRHVATSKVATYAYVNPVVALLLGWTLAEEPLTGRTLAAAAVILGAVVLITRYRRPAAASAPPPAPTPALGLCRDSG